MARKGTKRSGQRPAPLTPENDEFLKWLERKTGVRYESPNGSDIVRPEPCEYCDVIAKETGRRHCPIHLEQAEPVIQRTPGGFTITRPACVVCGEPPFGNEYACGHSQKEGK